MTEFLLAVIALLIAIIGWGGRSAVKWGKESWDKHVQGEDKFRAKIDEELKSLKEGIKMFFEELPPLKQEIEKIPGIERKVNTIEKDVVLIKKKIKI